VIANIRMLQYGISMRVAYFDLDKTILSVNTADLWFNKLRREKRIKWHQFARGAYWMLQYRLGRAQIETQILKAIASIEGYSFQEMYDEFALLFEERIRHLYRPGALQALQEHKAASDKVVLLTSAPSLVAEMIAKDLALDGCLATRLETNADGKFTGRIEGTLCYGEGKVTVATAHAQNLGHSLKESYFYTDSFTDVPLLAVVGHPIVINPDIRLLRFAKKQGWRIEDWGFARHDK
jgi:HAD superfamily hydrolase (TIGR01490 family)